MKRLFIRLTATLIIFVILIFLLDIYMVDSARDRIYKSVKTVPPAYTALVLGAYVSKSGVPSYFLRDRLDCALELYRAKKVKRLLLSGDHGTVDYDEVNHMRDYLLENGVDTRDIFLDHAGFDTYSSIVRAKEIFGVKEMIIVTQEFHLSRAIYIAKHKNVKSYGIIADKTNYGSLAYLNFREKIARIKAFVEVITNKKPKYLGEKIPITGDSRKSYDRK